MKASRFSDASRTAPLSRASAGTVDARFTNLETETRDAAPHCIPSVFVSLRQDCTIARLHHVKPASPHVSQIGLPRHDEASCVQPGSTR